MNFFSELCNRVIYFAIVLLIAAGVFNILPASCSWNARPLSTEWQGELRVRLPEEINIYPFNTTGWLVQQAQCGDFFFDVHAKELKGMEKNDFLTEAPPQRIMETFQQYQLENVTLKDQKRETIHNVGVRHYSFTGEKQGKDYEMEVITTPRHDMLVMTYIYHAGSKKAKEEVEESISSLEFVEKDK